MSNCWVVTRTSQYRTYVDAKLGPKVLFYLPAFGEGRRSFLCLWLHLCGSDGISFPRCQYGNVLGTMVHTRQTYCSVPPSPSREDVLAQLWGPSCYLCMNMSQDFPLFSYMKGNEHFRKMLTAERGRWFWESGWKAQPLQWLKRSRISQKAVSEMQAEWKWQWGVATGCKPVWFHSAWNNPEAEQNDSKDSMMFIMFFKIWNWKVHDLLCPSVPHPKNSGTPLMYV